ncbi:g5166 [Coccomyxa viridis]|uniref:G5166 protein n=1 Tax=Coccomyxa viridis TaxID=1274662 RepID=A0ABP1FS55_9CHLO
MQSRTNASAQSTLQGPDITAPEADAAPTHAIVLGASVAGLLSAAALSDYVDSVTILDKDAFVSERLSHDQLKQQFCSAGEQYLERARSRRGVPQYIQLHGLLSRGAKVIEDLLPGWTALAQELGAVSYEPGTVKTYYNGQWTYHPQVKLGISSLSATRDLIEQSLRTQLLSLKPNVTITGGAIAETLLWDEQKTRVQGIRLKDGRETKADLVVDASGRRSKLPGWLQEAGYQPPAESHVDSHLGYAMRLYELPDQEKHDDSWSAIYIRASPDHPRGGIVMKMENQLCHCESPHCGDHSCTTIPLSFHLRKAGGMFGYSGDHPPGDVEGHMDFIKSLRQPDVWEKLKDATPLTQPMRYVGIENVRRYYEHVRLPDRLCVLGDSAAAFNPVYGQGMTVSAVEAEALHNLLKEKAGTGKVPSKAISGVSAAFQRMAGKIVDFPWDAATGEDFSYPATTGERPQKSWAEQQIGAYIADLLEIAPHDASVFSDIMPVFHMREGPEKLLTPRLIAKALLYRAARMFRKPSGQAAKVTPTEHGHGIVGPAAAPVSTAAIVSKASPLPAAKQPAGLK